MLRRLAYAPYESASGSLGMVRVMVAATLLMLGLAGCSTGQEVAIETPTPSATSSSAAASVAPPVPLLTDTLYLLDAPHMAATLNARTEPFRSPVPSAADQVSGILGASPILKWSMPRPNLTALAGSAIIWVDVQGFVAHQDATNPCFWQLSLRLDRDDGGFYATSAGCVEEPAVVPEGIRAIEFAFEGIDVSSFVGEELSIQLTTTALAAAPGATVSALSGSLEHDSRLTVVGIQVPLDTQTLLQ